VKLLEVPGIAGGMLDVVGVVAAAEYAPMGISRVAAAIAATRSLDRMSSPVFGYPPSVLLP
jgi:hypothetical protein